MSITENSLFVRFFLSLWLCLKNAAANSALGRACDRLEDGFSGRRRTAPSVPSSGGRAASPGRGPTASLAACLPPSSTSPVLFSRPSTGRENGCGTPVCSAA